MEDYRDERSASYRQIRQNIRQLQSKLRASRDSLQRREIVDEISKLEQERLHDGNLFLGDDYELPEDDVTGEEFPILGQIWNMYEDLVLANRKQDRDVLGLMLYDQYFDQEFLGFLTQRRLKLDVKYSMVRDTFYNLFNQLDRTMQNYLAESIRIGEGNYTKKYEEDILKRLVEMRHGLFIDADKFYRRLKQFSDDLLEDLEEDQILCQNGSDFLSFSSIDTEMVLRGITVQEALEKLYDLAKEVIDYLNVPDFQR